MGSSPTTDKKIVEETKDLSVQLLILGLRKLFELHINWPEHQIRKEEDHIPSSHGAEENNKAIKFQ